MARPPEPIAPEPIAPEPIPPEPIPIVLVSGFLGSGKTTFLNRLMARAGWRDTVFVVNEFGAVGVDQNALPRQSGTYLLRDGCMCCAHSGSVAGTLRTVLREAQRLDRKVARVVIETSGVALPGQIVESLLADPVVRSLFYVATVLSVVDATQIADQLERYDEVGAQIAAADAVYVSKTDLPGTALAVLRPAIAALNPFCRVLSGDAWPLSDGWLEARNDIRAMRQGNLRDLPAGAHGRAFDSFHIPVPSGVPMARLSEFTDAVTYLLGDRILRAKGFVRVREHRRWVLVNIVRRTLYPPVFSDAALAPGESGLVFIVEDLDRDTVAEFLSLALRPEGPAQADRQEAAHV